MTAAQFRRIRKQLGLSDRDLADRIGVCRRQVLRYADGTTPIRKPIATAILAAVASLAEG